MRQRRRVKRRYGYGARRLGCATVAVWALLAASAFALPEAGPVITNVQPPKGSIVGGTRVTIFGHDFTGATAVTFGLVPATSYTVESDTDIVALVPPRSKPGPVDVAVTTPVETTGALAPDQFDYLACVVPKLKHRELKAAKEALRKKECRPGKVSRAPGAGKSAKVIKQGQRPKTVLPPGSKVNVKLGG